MNEIIKKVNMHEIERGTIKSVYLDLDLGWLLEGNIYFKNLHVLFAGKILSHGHKILDNH